MKQENKELLIKDLCARLDTNLVCSIYRTDDEGVGYRDEILHGYCKGDIWYEFYFREDCSIGIDNVSKIKPYLFPLSSMTEEQLYKLKEITDFKYNHNTLELLEWSETHTTLEFWLEEVPQYKVIEVFDWLDKNHFDYRCLIERGLAIDATGLNIY